MTHDEIREALRLDFEQTADWRRSKAAEDPEDSRNLEAAALLDKLAASVETVAPALLDAYGSLRDDYMDSEQHSEMFRQIGFHSWPETAEDFVKACIADRAMERKVRERQRRGRSPRRKVLHLPRSTPRLGVGVLSCSLPHSLHKLSVGFFINEQALRSPCLRPRPETWGNRMKLNYELKKKKYPTPPLFI